MTTLSSIRKNRQKEERTAGLDSAEVAVLAGGSNLVFSTLDSLPASDLTPGLLENLRFSNKLLMPDK